MALRFGGPGSSGAWHSCVHAAHAQLSLTPVHQPERRLLPGSSVEAAHCPVPPQTRQEPKFGAHAAAYSLVRSIRTRLPACYLRARLAPGVLGRAAPSAAHVEPAQARQARNFSCLLCAELVHNHCARGIGRLAAARALEGQREQQVQLHTWESSGRSLPRRAVERPYSRQAAARSSTQPRRAIVALLAILRHCFSAT
jgi:hypothetical protein